MGSALSKYGILLLGQIIDGIALLVHAGQAPDVKPPDPSTVSQLAVSVISWVAATVVSLVAGRLLHKEKPPGLTPTPVDTPETNQELAQAAGEAFRKASEAAGAKKP